MNNGSSSGPDGIFTEFYKQFWQIIKDPIIESYKNGYETGSLSGTQKQRIISLIHKDKELGQRNVPELEAHSVDLRREQNPSKTLALRLQDVLNLVVEDTKFGFIPERKKSQLLQQIGDITDYLKEITMKK
ncbi:reverse transcriptase [Elysia marginata]|uniref:Reverse transcriptase n=1 Tax=Elysia marginata TaxID=1093978 RepID=A0AAV4HT15_9GAST|nr:reverse transcriptase [Elysia marginata]